MIFLMPRFLDRDLESYFRVAGDIVYPVGLLDAGDSCNKLLTVASKQMYESRRVKL